jgi:hypothetical protein
VASVGKEHVMNVKMAFSISTIKTVPHVLRTANIVKEVQDAVYVTKASIWKLKHRHVKPVLIIVFSVNLSQVVLNVTQDFSSTALDNVKLPLRIAYFHLWIVMVMGIVVYVKPAITGILTHHYVNPVRITVGHVTIPLLV